MTAADLLPARRTRAAVAVRKVVIVRSGHPGVLWPSLWGVTYTAIAVPGGVVLGRAHGFWRLRAWLKAEYGHAIATPLHVVDISSVSWLWPRADEHIPIRKSTI